VHVGVGRREVAIAYSAQSLGGDLEPLAGDEEIDVPDKPGADVRRELEEEERQTLQEHRLDADRVQGGRRFPSLRLQATVAPGVEAVNRLQIPHEVAIKLARRI
jgi:hypothetical protein